MGAGGQRPLAGLQAAFLAAWVAAVLPRTADALHLRSLPSSAFVDGPAPSVEGYEVLNHGRFGLDTKGMAALGGHVLLYVVISAVALSISLLLVCCMYDAAARWCHRAHFHACERKVERVHKAFSKRKGDFPLCPYCVEPISNQPSPSKVVFLCGHRFHVDCVNKWFCEAPSKAGCCPICDDMGAQAMDAEQPEANGEAADATSANDEAQSFILQSLHRLYPEIIPKACMKRWASCNTEIWLSDLSCPKYHSILAKKNMQ